MTAYMWQRALERARRDLAASPAPARPDPPVLAQVNAIGTGLATRALHEPCHWPRCKMTRPGGQAHCDEGRNCNG
jgi:hypothetical protein